MAAVTAQTDWRPGADLRTLRLRAELLRRIRHFFERQDVLEVQTPALSRAATTDPHIHSMATAAGPGQPRFLHTSPELAMKRLLAAGVGDIYQVCPVFRCEESGALHNPEFSMLEYYRVGMDHHDLMRDVADLISAATAGWLRLGEPHFVPYGEAFFDHAGCDPFHDEAATIAAAITARGVDIPDSIKTDGDALIDLAMATIVSPQLGRGRLSFVYDFPLQQAALARSRPGDPPVAERFEAFVDGLELANGFHELLDPVEQRRRFDADLERRRRLGLPQVAVDERFLAALEAGMPACAGVALGLDRLLMLIAGAKTLGEVLAFGWERV